MPEEEIAALADDITKNGQREPGVLYEGMVLDGWHRYLACERAGRKFMCGDYGGDDPIAFVISKNLHRRHLTALQKAAAIVAATNWRKRGSATVADPSVKSLAEKADVSPRTIEHAKSAQEMGLGAEAREGKVTARQVEQVAKLPKAKREEAIKAIKDGEAPPTSRRAKGDKGELEKACVRISALETDLEQTKSALAEMTDLAKCAQAFEEKKEFQEMKVLRVQIASCARRRDELMAENAALKKEVLRWRKKAIGK